VAALPNEGIPLSRIEMTIKGSDRRRGQCSRVDSSPIYEKPFFNVQKIYKTTLKSAVTKLTVYGSLFTFSFAFSPIEKRWQQGHLNDLGIG
jgi:hypothetical protein